MRAVGSAKMAMPNTPTRYQWLAPILLQEDILCRRGFHILHEDPRQGIPKGLVGITECSAKKSAMEKSTITNASTIPDTHIW